MREKRAWPPGRCGDPVEYRVREKRAWSLGRCGGPSGRRNEREEGMVTGEAAYSGFELQKSFGHVSRACYSKITKNRVCVHTLILCKK